MWVKHVSLLEHGMHFLPRTYTHPTDREPFAVLSSGVYSGDNVNVHPSVRVHLNTYMCTHVHVCSGFKSKDSDFASDHHAADIRRVYLVIIVNQLVAT
ncbi:hypothetical protein AVEN_26389-1 [Araneus ventricosus]|uniref:Uncharacterized protein n=1 Tax=Araneus ventricosus TaxID=182803 RepID=A0A4Y2SD58_ARAVE|nr:hypothetical protein AVEN_26389-1 [Araneus ventricosus]